jgi:bifunctional DNA-binding transcriptional regulator/antitoxin component of YhaV-PrlF toxin-antitoxin module
VAVVKVKSHYQVTIPPQIRAKAGVVVGDLFEAKV